MKLAIVEDEKIHQDYLLSMLNIAADNLGINLSYNLFKSAESFLFEFEDQKYDAILLDIKLNEMSGFSLAELIRKQDNFIPIAFITGEENFVFDGYRVDACAYILKPIMQQDISFLLNKIHKKITLTKPSISIKAKEGMINLYENDIYYIESHNHKTNVITKKTEYISSNKMSQWEKILCGKNFFKPHRSYLINFYYVERIDKKNITIKCDVLIPIARGKWQSLMKAYMDYKRKDYS